VAGVLDEPYSQLTPLSGVAVQARQTTKAGTVSRLSYVAWRAGMATPLLSKVRLKLPLQLNKYRNELQEMSSVFFTFLGQFWLDPPCRLFLVYCLSCAVLHIH
jgi:hypothetical protein